MNKSFSRIGRLLSIAITLAASTGCVDDTEEEATTLTATVPLTVVISLRDDTGRYLGPDDNAHIWLGSTSMNSYSWDGVSFFYVPAVSESDWDYPVEATAMNYVPYKGGVRVNMRSPDLVGTWLIHHEIKMTKQTDQPDPLLSR